jgi:2,3-dihydroxybenzoate-AMP ligase
MTLEGFVPWPSDVAERYRREGLWRGDTIGEMLRTWAEQYGDRIALVDGDTRLTYVQLDEDVDRLAAALVGLGIRPRDRVLVQLPNVHEFVTLFLALIRIGALPVHALPAHRKYETAYLAEFSKAVAYAVPTTFRGFDYAALARDVQAEVASLQYLLVVGDAPDDGFMSITYLLESAPDVVTARAIVAPYAPVPDDVAFFLLSGGTTGMPKLIPRTHDDYSYNLRASGEVCGFNADTVYLVSLPIAHNFPLGCPGALGTFHVGGRVVLNNDPSAAGAFPLIESERVTITALVPALAIRWLEAPEREQHDLSSLQLLQVGGARLNPEVAQRIKPLLGSTPQQVFGMAEGLLNYTRVDDPDDALEDTQGRPISPHDELRIVDTDGNPVSDGEMGELLTRGPYTIRGYYMAEEHNRTAFTEDGFYRTGDVVRRRADGNLVVEGRIKDLVNRGGEKISAEEIENLILAHSKVSNVAVVPMPDKVMGERACAYVIQYPGDALTLEELVVFLRKRDLATFKLPERLELVDSFPLTAVGKVNKGLLREDVTRKLEAGSP